MINFQLNGEPVAADDAADTPLLWVLRDTFKLTGSKYGCGVGLCGACTVHVNDKPVRSCVTPIASCSGQSVTTIEGLAENGVLHPLQEAWVQGSVPQCGYCQSGQIMSAAALLKENQAPSPEAVDEAMSGNLCRCGCYPRIKQAILEVAERRNASLVLGGEA